MATWKEFETALQRSIKEGNTEATSKLIGAMQKHFPDQYSAFRDEQARAEYAAMSTPEKAITAISDILRMGSNSITFGLRDRIDAMIEGTTHEEEKRRTQDARARAGSAGLIADIGPQAALLMATGGSSAVPAMVARAPGGAVTKGAIGAAGAAVEGSLIGLLNALGYGEDPVEAMKSGAAFGAGGRVATNLGNKAARAATKAVHNALPNRATSAANRLFGGPGARSTVPAARLHGQADDILEEGDKIGAQYSKSGATSLSKKLHTGRNRVKGMSNEADNFLKRIDDELDSAELGSGAPVARRVENLRDDVVDFASKPGREGQIGREMLDSMDNWLDDAGPKVTTPKSGDAQEAIGRYKEARGVRNQAKKTANFEEVQRLSTRGKEANDPGTFIRDQANAQTAPSVRGKYTPEEFDQLEYLSKGSSPERTLRGLAHLTAKNTFTNALFGAPSRRVADKYTKRNLEDLLELLSSGRMHKTSNDPAIRTLMDTLFKTYGGSGRGLANETESNANLLEYSRF